MVMQVAELREPTRGSGPSRPREKRARRQVSRRSLFVGLFVVCGFVAARFDPDLACHALAALSGT